MNKILLIVILIMIFSVITVDAFTVCTGSVEDVTDSYEDIEFGCVNTILNNQCLASGEYEYASTSMYAMHDYLYTYVSVRTDRDNLYTDESYNNFNNCHSSVSWLQYFWSNRPVTIIHECSYLAEDFENTPDYFDLGCNGQHLYLTRWPNDE